MPAEPLTAIILAGGQGTRIASVLGDQPKVLAPIRGRAYLDYLLRFLSDSGIVDKAVIAAGNGAAAVLAHCREVVPPLPVAFSVETSPLGTGGAVLKALEVAPGRTVLVVNGDSYIDVDLKAMRSTHDAALVDATVVAVRVDDAGGYGTMELDDDWVSGFVEKSGRAEAAWVNAGLYLFDRPALGAFPNRACSLERDILPKLIDGRVRAHKSKCPFIDIGTPDSYAMAERFFPEL